MKKTIIALMMLAMPALGMAAGSSVPLDSANVDLSDRESLQRGAKIFTDYCLHCHSANYMRFNRLQSDLGMGETDVKAIMHTTDKMGDTMTIALNPKQAKVWFGTLPPDLTVISRFRGEDWLYTYLRSFYEDEGRPFGVNNTVFKDVGMPHVLADMQGLVQPVMTDGKVTGLGEAKGGTMTPAEYDGAVRDLVSYMVYMGEPAKLIRYELGTYVILFLIVLSILLYLVKKEYWRDVH